MASLGNKDLIAYQASRLASGKAPASINSELGALNAVFAWAVRNNHLAGAPVCERVPEPPIRSIVPTPEEAVRILAALPLKYRPIVRFLAETGRRKGEAQNLNWDCVDEVNGLVYIESRDGWTPKTQSSERCIPLNEALLDEVRKLPKLGAFVFPGATPDKPMGDFRKPWKRAVAEAKIMRRGRQVHIPVKSLRKAHAAWQAERGVAESVLQGLMGHAKGSRMTRKFYVQVTDEAKRAAVIQLPTANTTTKK